MTTASPTKLLAARYAIAATAIASTTALTVGLAAPAVAATNVAHPTGAVAADNADPRQVTTDVALAALIDNFIGVYGVGPVFQALRMAGVNDPANLLKQAVGLIGNEQLSEAVGALTDVLGALADEIPIDAAVPGFGPAGVYDRMNALSYSGGLTSGINDILEGIGAIVGGDVEDLATNLQTILNQRRAFILGTGLGGTDTAMALNKMISEVEKDSALWGDGDNGVTAVVAVLLRNPSRTGGGLFALVTPISEIVGLDFSNPAGGSYTNKKVTENGLATKVLNVSITDVGWKYDLIADAPSTLNPLSWANAAAGLVMPTYLLPKDLSTTTGSIGDLVYPGVVNAVYDAVSVTLDPTGGQGISLLTQGTFLEGGGVLADEVIGYIMEAISPPGVEFDFPFAGDSTYLTYNSGNLPLLEPFNVLPRLLGYTGAKISTPITGSFNNVLTQLVDFGYKDAVRTVGTNGVWAFERTSEGIAAGAAEQSDVFLLPDSKNFSQWEATFELPQMVFDATLTGIQSSLLNPNNQLNLWGLDLGQYVYRNELTLAVANAVSQAIDAVKKPVNNLFNSGQSALEPVTKALDTATEKVNGVILDTRKALTGYVDLSNPVFEVNRAINNVVDLDGGIPGLISNPGGALSIPDINAGNLNPIARGVSASNEAPQGALNVFNDSPQVGTFSVPVDAPAPTGDTKPESVTDRIQNAPKRALDEVTALPGKAERELRKGGDKLQERGEKLRGSVDTRQKEIREIAEVASKDPIKGVTETGKFAGERVKRAAKDVGNGVKKVGEAGQRIAKSVEKTVKRVTGNSDKPKADNNK